MRSWLSRWGIPILGSFCVYLVPLVGPHAVWPLGAALFAQLTGAGGLGPAWLAANFAVALAAQLALGLTLAWSLRGSRLRLLVWLVGIPILTAS